MAKDRWNATWVRAICCFALFDAAMIAATPFDGAVAETKRKPIAAEAPAALPPPATGVTVIAPIFAELVSFTLPKTFQTVFENADADRYIREAVMAGETLESWSQMVTVTAAKGLATNPEQSPRRFIAMLARGFKTACPDTFSATVLDETRISDHDAFSVVVSCGIVVSSPTRHSESVLIIAVKGRADMYTIQWSERAQANAENLVIDEMKWRGRAARLAPIKFCRVMTGEVAPYPSCLSSGR